MAGALQPEVLEAWIGLAAQMRAALVESPDVERGPVALFVLARHERLASGIDEDDERPGVWEVRRKARGNGQCRILELHVLERADPKVGVAEAALQVRPEESDEAAGHLGQPEGDPAAQRDPQEAAPGHPLDRVVAEALERLRGQRLGLVDGLDVVVAHRWSEVPRARLTGRSGARSCCSRRTAGTG